METTETNRDNWLWSGLRRILYSLGYATSGNRAEGTPRQNDWLEMAQVVPKSLVESLDGRRFQSAGTEVIFSIGKESGISRVANIHFDFATIGPLMLYISRKQRLIVLPV